MKVISIVNTNYSLDFDDRVNKESVSLMKRGFIVEFIALESKNLKYNGITKYGARFQTLQLVTRKVFSSGKAIPVKLIEWNFRLLLILLRKKWNILWLNDFDGILILFYARIVKLIFPHRKIIWDHHELAPTKLLNSGFYRWLIGGCDFVLHANLERVHYTIEKLPNEYHSRFKVLENYPNSIFMNFTDKSIDQKFTEWISSHKYCLFQGAALVHRKVLECISAVYEIPEMRIVIMGPCSDNLKELIMKSWPDSEMRVYITGWLEQTAFSKYMDNAIASLIFYDNIDTNHWFCAPNRFYHAILRGLPVICGPNPPMKRIVEDYKIGVCCQKNGENVAELVLAINEILNSGKNYKNNCITNREKFIWENQEYFFDQIK